MMYLSRLILNPRSRQVWRDLADCHQLHRTILRAFPQSDDGSSARDAFGVLYRVDTHPRTGVVSVLVQSLARPDWSVLPSGYLADLDDRANPACKAVENIYAQLRSGDELVFRLRANPTRRVNARRKPDDPLRGKRVELQRKEDQLNWLQRKGEDAGFRLLKVRAVAESTEGQVPRARRGEEVFGVASAANGPIPDVRPTPGVKVTGAKSSGKRLAFGSVLFEGRLAITDADRFREAIARGIGSGKAYGFGLLSVAPAR